MDSADLWKCMGRLYQQRCRTFGWQKLKWSTICFRQKNENKALILLKPSLPPPSPSFNVLISTWSWTMIGAATPQRTINCACDRCSSRNQWTLDSSLCLFEYIRVCVSMLVYTGLKGTWKAAHIKANLHYWGIMLKVYKKRWAFFRVTHLQWKILG